MSSDILIVDNNRLFLGTLSQEIESRLGERPHTASDPNLAMEIIGRNRIKVMLVDQRMPGLTGLELVEQVRAKTDGLVQFMMMTAYENDVPRDRVVGFHGFFRKEDLPKSLDRLCETILAAKETYDQKRLDRSVVEVEQLIDSHKALISFWNETSVTLVRIVVADPNYIVDGDWQTICKAERNIEKTHEIAFESHSRAATTIGLTEDLSSLQQATVGTVFAKVQSQLNVKSSLQVRKHYERDETVKLTTTIKTTPITDGDAAQGTCLEARAYQAAPVFVKCDCLLNIECSMCRIPHRVWCSVLLPTTRIASRYLEYFNDGRVNCSDTGSLAVTVVVP